MKERTQPGEMVLRALGGQGRGRTTADRGTFSKSNGPETGESTLNRGAEWTLSTRGWGEGMPYGFWSVCLLISAL